MKSRNRKEVKKMAEMIELRKLRKYHELTCKDMANLIKVDERTYINKEKGVSQFKLNEMFIISRKFKMSMDEIFLPNDFMNHEVFRKEGEKVCNS